MKAAALLDRVRLLQADYSDALAACRNARHMPCGYQDYAAARFAAIATALDEAKEAYIDAVRANASQPQRDDEDRRGCP